MRIDSLDLYHVALPLRTPRTTDHGPISTLETVLVRLTSGSQIGWGEASPGNSPAAYGDWAAGVFGCVRDWLGPRVVGQSLDTNEAFQECMAPVRGNRFAKAVLDTAWWDLKARSQSKSLVQLLGGRQEAIEVGAGFDRMESIDEFANSIRQAFAAGFSRVELKMRPGWDLNMLNFVRHEFPTERIHVDVEGGLRLNHMELLCRLDDFALAMIEQPLPADDFVGHAMVQETIRTHVCLDESITSPEHAEMAMDLKSGRYVNLKVGRVGGLTAAGKIHDICHEHCTPCWVGTDPLSAIGLRFGYALASKPNCLYPADYIVSDGLLAEDLAEPLRPVKGEDGKLRIPLWSEPGVGVEPDMAILDRLSLAVVSYGGCAQG
jgi:O-succinylbenzoate synthase